MALEVAHAEVETVERALAHTIKSKAQAAYDRSDLLDRRRPIMTAWAKFLWAEIARRSLNSSPTSVVPALGLFSPLSQDGSLPSCRP